MGIDSPWCAPVSDRKGIQAVTKPFVSRGTILRSADTRIVSADMILNTSVKRVLHKRGVSLSLLFRVSAQQHTAVPVRWTHPWLFQEETRLVEAHALHPEELSLRRGEREAVRRCCAQLRGLLCG